MTTYLKANDFSPDGKKDFFISYSHEDKSWAAWIGWQLEVAGYSVLLQDWDFSAGRNFVRMMDQSVRRAYRLLAVISRSYMKSEFTQPEWLAYFKEDPTSEKRLIVPVLIEPCELGGLLAQISFIDLAGLTEDLAREQLLAGVGGQRLKPLSSPAYPGERQNGRRAESPPFPTGLPEINNIPQRQNRFFVGRDDLLTKLHEQLAEKKLVGLIHGLGGVGKTQLAIEYIYRYGREYDVAWWLRAEKAISSPIQEYLDLAYRLKLAVDSRSDSRSTISSVRDWLDSHDRWLLVFDNAERQGVLADYIPRSERGHVLITSRNPNWRDLADELKVTELARSFAVELLLKRTGRTDVRAADLVADQLGDLPLALAQAAAFMQETGWSFEKYSTAFETQRNELLASGLASDSYPETVATTWGVSFQQIRRQPSAVDLLNLMAFLAPEKIQLTHFEDRLDRMPDSLNTEIKLAKAIATLRSYSLIDSAEDKTLSIHRLVRAVTRDRLTKSETAQYEDLVNSLLRQRPVEVVRPEAAIEVVSLSCFRGHRRVLADIELRIHPNKVTAIIGPSGSGKSTLLQCLHPALAAHENLSLVGKVLIAGEDIYADGEGASLARRSIATVAQEISVLPGSVYDNVAYALRCRGIRKRRDLDAPVEEALRSAGIWDSVKDRLDNDARFLSVGQQRSLMLARALTTNPEILLIDNFAAEPSILASVEDLIFKLKESCTIVIVFQDMQAASRISDYVAFLYLGELIEFGETGRLFLTPLKKQTEDFITGRFG